MLIRQNVEKNDNGYWNDINSACAHRPGINVRHFHRIKFIIAVKLQLSRISICVKLARNEYPLFFLSLVVPQMLQIISSNLNNIWKGCAVHTIESVSFSFYSLHRKPNTCQSLFASVELLSNRFLLEFLFANVCWCFNGNSFIFLRLPQIWLGLRMNDSIRNLVSSIFCRTFFLQNTKCTRWIQLWTHAQREKKKE